MRRASYREACMWIAESDDPGSLDLETIEALTTVALIADLFGAEVARVARDVRRRRRASGASQGGPSRPARALPARQVIREPERLSEATRGPIESARAAIRDALGSFEGAPEWSRPSGALDRAFDRVVDADEIITSALAEASKEGLGT